MAAALAHRFAQLEQRLSACEAALMSDPGVALLLRFADIEARIIAVANALKVDLDVGAPIATTETRAVGHPTSGPVASPDFGIPQDADASPTQQRLHKELVEKGFTNFRFVRVPGDYYDQPLEYRQACLSASSIDHLCKSIICQNTRAHPSVVHDDPLNPHNWADWRNSRYYCLIVQYSARLHFEKLKTFVHRLNEGKVGKQYFNLRLAPEDVNDALSGYTHNAVSPIGMAAQLPMIMSHQIAELQPDFFFLGAGEVDLKVGLTAKEFIDKYKPMVADITY